jgi:hypothetical protein
LKLDKENIQLLIKESQLQVKTKREQLKLLDKKVYKKNKFQFYPEENPWTPVYIDLEKYNETKEIYATYFSHIYQDLLSECCDALKMPYLFSFVPDKKVIDDSLFIKDTSSRIKNKNNIIRKSAYLLHLVKTFEENDFDHSAIGCVNALFEYDDIQTIEIVRNVLISFFVRGAINGISNQLKIFKKNTGEVLKRKKTIEKKKSEESQVSTIEKDEFEENPLPKWFPIGLGFATGEIQTELSKDISSSKIAIKLTGKRSNTNYVSFTYNNTEDPKNIYSKLDKLEQVYNHCVKNDIKICDDFMKAYNIKLKK